MAQHVNGAVPAAASRSVIGLISDQVRKSPQAPAVVCGDRQLTYQELDALSSQAARLIHGLDAREHAPVAVCMLRSIDAIVALLAVLKAGGFFVPLDPGHPQQRLTSTIADSGATVLLTDRPEDWSGQVADVEVVAVNQVPVRDPLDSDVQNAICDTDLAYVIYTSGSSGQPKGVMVEHGAFGCHIEAMCRLYELSPGDRVLQHSSLAFDTALEAIFCALAAGAQLVIAPHLLGPAELVDMVSRYGVTWVELTPAYWAQVVDMLPSLEETALESLRMLVLGGDTVPAGTLEKFMAMRPAIQVLNTYGPTEATIGCAAFCVPPAWRGTTVPIGRPPVPEKPVYILDDNLNVVPDGDIGEICVAGPVARGYLHDPVLTAERFVTWQPPAGGSPKRVYRTGDRGARRADGTIEFFGRMDRQVKIRGTRVEPAEIEGVLSKHPAVLGVAVVPVGDVTNRDLVAYIHWANGAHESIEDLRRLAREHLTGAMLPTSWISVESIPTTVSGKVDVSALSRTRLAEPGDSQVETGEVIAAQSEAGPTQLEETIADIWRDVLGVPSVEPQDNFFDLGGHSLAAMVLVFRLSERFSVDIPLTAAFTYPTPQDMAEFITQTVPEEGDSITDLYCSCGRSVGGVPAYVEQSYFVPIQAIPPDMNGKLDRTVLPYP